MIKLIGTKSNESLVNKSIYYSYKGIRPLIKVFIEDFLEKLKHTTDMVQRDYKIEQEIIYESALNEKETIIKPVMSIVFIRYNDLRGTIYVFSFHDVHGILITRVTIIDTHSHVFKVNVEYLLLKYSMKYLGISHSVISELKDYLEGETK